MLVLSGIANVAGPLMVYRALGTGRIGVVALIVRPEGAVTAVLAIIGGQAVGVGSRPSHWPRSSAASS